MRESGPPFRERRTRRASRLCRPVTLEDSVNGPTHASAPERLGVSMDRCLVPAEYELSPDLHSPPEASPGGRGRWFAALAAISMILGASLALATGGESERPAQNQFGR